MYKVNYFTLGICKDGDIGNILQYRDTYYTEHKIETIPDELQRVVDLLKGENKYVSVIEKIEYIDGHGER